MSGQNENKNNYIEVVKWIAIGLLIFLGIGLNFYFAKIALTLRLVGWLALSGIVLVAAYYTNLGKQGWEFAQQSWVEMQKVVWPTRDETAKVTLAVVVVVLIVALILWGIDSTLLFIMGLLTGQRG